MRLLSAVHAAGRSFVARAGLSAALLLLLLPTWSGEPRRPLFGRAPQVSFTRVALDSERPGRTRLGRLTYLGGVAMRSDDPAFGGFSAMLVEGDRFLLLSDAGLTFGFRMGADFVPRDQRFGSLDAGPGSGWSRTERDTESLARDPTTGTIWVGYESPQAIWRYRPDLTQATASATPPPMRDWPRNGGAEAMARLRDGRFIVISEQKRVKGVPGARQALLFAGDPTVPGARPAIFAYRPPARHSPTDLVQLPDGRLLVLDRRAGFQGGFTARLGIIDPRAIRPGATVASREVARFEAPVLHDNFEALAAVREGNGTIVWVASDDNLSGFQRSLLLKFRLEP